MRSKCRSAVLEVTTAMVALGMATFGAGCGRQAIATTDALPVSRVVVYRNGVAYFERQGHVDGGEVRFRMKRTEVGDFLATLAVMERGGSSVRAAAFPLPDDSDGKGGHDGSENGAGGASGGGSESGDDSESGEGRDSKPGEAGASTGANEGNGRAPRKRDALETVVLSLDGKSHELQVGYVAESPVWRPSYRLVVHPEGDADLQAWGIVQNLSGEDWKNVKLSLIAGAPLAFQAELGTPVIPPRPIVTDEGEVIAAVPRAETSLGQEPPGSPSPPPPPVAEPADNAADEEESAPEGSAGPRAMAKKADADRGGGDAPAATRAAGDMHRSTAPRPVMAPAPMAAAAISPPRTLRSLAAVAVEGGSTRYDLPLAVTIPDRSATMVMLLSRSVSGEALFLFAPDGGVPDSSSHPFRVARFTNGTAGMLERGPIAVFEGGAFLGQGMVDPLPPGGTATVPFALERGIAVDEDRKFDELGGRLAKIENSELTIERDRVTQTHYRIRNGGDQAEKLLVKHPRIGGASLFSPPPGTEDNVGSGSALVPASIPARSTAELVVDERVTERRPTDWFTPVADTAIKAYVADRQSDRDVVTRLTAAWITRTEIVTKMAERDKLQQASNSLSSSTEETRRNLRAIEKNKTAEPLRQKLTARLADAATKLDDYNRKIVELDSKLSELTVQFREAIRDIKFTPSPAG